MFARFFFLSRFFKDAMQSARKAGCADGNVDDFLGYVEIPVKVTCFRVDFSALNFPLCARS